MGALPGKVAEMVKRAKIMNGREMEQWLIKKGAVPVTEEVIRNCFLTVFV